MNMTERRAIDDLRQDAHRILKEVESGERTDLPDRAVELARYIYDGYRREQEYSDPLLDNLFENSGDADQLLADYQQYIDNEVNATQQAAELVEILDLGR